MLAAEEREQDIPGKLEQEAESEATDAMPSKLATGTPDLAGDAVSNTSEETNAPVKRGLEGPADTVTNSGMQGQVAESATSSNARQQSTASVASTRPASASKPTSTIGACTCALHGTLSLCMKSSIFATAFMPLSVGLLGTMTACFDAEAEWHLLPAWRLAKFFQHISCGPLPLISFA